jgi:hypothetical protein
MKKALNKTEFDAVSRGRRNVSFQGQPVKLSGGELYASKNARLIKYSKRKLLQNDVAQYNWIFQNLNSFHSQSCCVISFYKFFFFF